MESIHLPSSKIGECEVCDKNEIEVKLHYGNMYFCDECWTKEVKLSEAHQSLAAQQKRLDEHQSTLNQYSGRFSEPVNEKIQVNEVIKKSREIDNSIQVRTDLFNAATTSIIELKKAIDSDSSIVNKPYALASELLNRFNHYKQVVFELNQQVIEAGNNQKAIQIYLNNLANQLRQEEREKLKISDINYKPTPVKQPSVKKVSTRQTNKKTKLDKIELRKAAAILGVGEFTLQMICVSKNISIEEGAKLLKASLDAAKSNN